MLARTRLTALHLTDGGFCVSLYVRYRGVLKLRVINFATWRYSHHRDNISILIPVFLEQLRMQS